MPQYFSPGVYVEEVDAGPKPIEGVSTSIAGAVGVTERGPSEGKPVLVTSFAEYARIFGGAIKVDDAVKQSFVGGHFWDFPLSVKGFFDNGGQRLYVKRVCSSTAEASKAQLKTGIIARITKDVAAASDTLVLSHTIGVSKDAAIEVWIAGTKAADAKVKSYDASINKVVLDKTVGPLVSSNSYVTIGGALGAGPPAVKIEAKAKGVWGNGMRLAVMPTAPLVFNLMAADGEVEAKTTVDTDALATDTFKVKSVTGFKKDDVITVSTGAGAKDFTIDTVTGGAAKTIKVTANGDFLANARVEKRRVVTAAGGPFNVVNVWGASQLYPTALIEFDDGTNKFYTTVSKVDGTKVTLSTDLPNGAGSTPLKLFEQSKLRVIELAVRAVAEVGGGNPPLDEELDRLRPTDQSGAPGFFVSEIRNKSNVITVVSPAAFQVSDIQKLPCIDPAAASATTPPGWMDMTGGKDDLASLTFDDFVGEDHGPNQRTGIAALEDIDAISIVMAPGIFAQDVQTELIRHCETLKYRFAILDTPPVNPSSQTIIQDVMAVKSPLDSKYAALYWPWIAVRDPFARQTVDIAPSAHMAGIYARVDDDRGVFKAPANEVIAGIDIGNGKNGLQVEITRREQDNLNPIGINALRFFPNRGTRVWGARTISSDQSWKYINVRRLFIYVEASIDVGTQWVVFEPNDEPTWARVRQSITNFLISVWKDGGLQGAKQDEAFFVRCDKTTMSQDDIDKGRLICVIGIAPVKPAEFVIFRVQQKTMEQTP